MTMILSLARTVHRGCMVVFVGDTMRFCSDLDHY